MKKTFFLLGLLVITATTTLRAYDATLSLGSTDITGLMSGDTVKVPIILDNISPGAEIWGSQFYFEFDPDVISWTGTFDTINGWWTVSYDGDVMIASGAPEFVTPGISFIRINFIYLGGETDLTWASEYPNEMYDQTFDYFTLTLNDGCVCDLPDYDVTFHVTAEGEDLEGAIVTIGNLWLETDENGIAIFSLSDGQYSYTVTKEGFADEEGSFTVEGAPVQVEIEMEICGNFGIHLFVNGGNLLTDSALIIVNNDSLWTTSGGGTFCVPLGLVTYSVFSENYYPHSGALIFGGNLVLNLMMIPIPYTVTFFINCCGEPIPNYTISYEGQTTITDAAGLASLNLVAGFYNFEIGGVPVSFTVPDTTYVPVDICSEVTFHVTCNGMSMPGVSIVVEDETEFTNANGNALFCLQNGEHDYSVSKIGYPTISGSLTVNNAPLYLEEDICIYFPVPVQFEVTNANCENSFDGLFVVCNGDTIQPGGTMELDTGIYVWELILSGCGVIESGTFEVGLAPVTVEIIVPLLPQVTFHVTDQFNMNFEDAPVCLDDDTLYTDSSGLVSFCTTGGLHPYWVANPGYDTIHDNFIFDCTDTTLTVILMTGSVLNNEVSSFMIYPNPSTGRFYFVIEDFQTEPIELKVTNLTGRTVYEATQNSTGKVEFDLSEQPRGMYFIRFSSNGYIHTRKILIH